MNDDRSFQYIAAIATILSIPLMVTMTVLMLLPVNYNFDAINDLSAYRPTGVRGAIYGRWAMILDLLSYYPLIVLLALSLWRWLKPHSPNWVGLYAIFLHGYSFVGALGAVALAAVLPTLIVTYANTAESQRAII